jgi:hypothetical protein
MPSARIPPAAGSTQLVAEGSVAHGVHWVSVVRLLNQNLTPLRETDKKKGPEVLFFSMREDIYSRRRRRLPAGSVGSEKR